MQLFAIDGRAVCMRSKLFVAIESCRDRNGKMLDFAGIQPSV